MQYAAHRVFLFLLNQFVNRVSPRGVGKLRRLLARSGSQRQQLRNANDSDGAARSFCEGQVFGSPMDEPFHTDTLPSSCIPLLDWIPTCYSGNSARRMIAEIAVTVRRYS